MTFNNFLVLLIINLMALSVRRDFFEYGSLMYDWIFVIAGIIATIINLLSGMSLLGLLYSFPLWFLSVILVALVDTLLPE